MKLLAIFPALIVLVLIGHIVRASRGPADFVMERLVIIVICGLWAAAFSIRLHNRSEQRIRSRNLSICPSCGYPLENIKERVGACPECGRTFSFEEIVRIHVLEKRGE